MPILRKIILLLSLGLSAIASFATVETTAMAAEEAEQVRHGRHFPTAGRKMVVICSDSELKLRIGERLAAHGAIVVDDFISRLFAPRITVGRVAKIDGKSDTYSIQVNKTKIAIHYTSPDMLDRAIRQFYFLFDAPYGQRIIRGTDIYHQGDQPQKSNVNRNKAGIIDGVTTALTTTQVENAIRAQLRTNAGSDFTLAIANRKVIRFDFNALRGINTTAPTICSGEAKYTSDQIRRFVATAREAGGEFVPAIDLLSENETFQTYTGHSISSVEGMRFVRAIIEQCARQWGIKSICIGRRDNCTASQYYIDFLNDIASREDITLVIL